MSSYTIFTHTAFRVQRFASAPATSIPGDVYYDTTLNALFYSTASGVWAQVGLPAASGGPPTGTALFGDGSDGSVTFDGVTTVLGLAPSGGNTYTLTRDIYPSAMTINTGITINVAAFKIFVAGTLTNNGTISANGPNASGGTGGAGIVTATGTLFGTSGGGANGVTNGVGSAGTNVGASNAGAGGNGGAATNAGGAGGTVTAPLAVLGNVHSLPQALTTWSVQSTTVDARAFNAGAGGGSGGSDNAAATSGAGGAGGHFVGVYAKVIANGSGTISANGGNGSNGAGGAGNAGGGGGGGGGVVILIYNSLTLGTVTVNGGAFGTGLGTGASGVAGSAGLIVKINNNA